MKRTGIAKSYRQVWEVSIGIEVIKATSNVLYMIFVLQVSLQLCNAQLGLLLTTVCLSYPVDAVAILPGYRVR